MGRGRVIEQRLASLRWLTTIIEVSWLGLEFSMMIDLPSRPSLR